MKERLTDKQKKIARDPLAMMVYDYISGKNTKHMRTASYNELVNEVKLPGVSDDSMRKKINKYLTKLSESGLVETDYAELERMDSMETPGHRTNEWARIFHTPFKFREGLKAYREELRLEPLNVATAYARSMMEEINHGRELSQEDKLYAESAAVGLVILSELKRGNCKASE
ncbi:MAG: hypothetical protein ABIA12_00835 [Candidatus Aenigmatarchaeota archaeon]